jgi:hypothetical protein
LQRRQAGGSRSSSFRPDAAERQPDAPHLLACRPSAHIKASHRHVRHLVHCRLSFWSPKDHSHLRPSARGGRRTGVGCQRVDTSAEFVQSKLCGSYSDERRLVGYM